MPSKPNQLQQSRFNATENPDSTSPIFWRWSNLSSSDPLQGKTTRLPYLVMYVCAKKIRIPVGFARIPVCYFTDKEFAIQRRSTGKVAPRVIWKLLRKECKSRKLPLIRKEFYFQATRARN